MKHSAMQGPLAYTSNLLPAQSLNDIYELQIPFFTAVRQRCGWQQLGLDLHLGSELITELVQGQAAQQLRDALDHAGLCVTTINAFPFGAFQAGPVKDQAYIPDWHEKSRASDTCALLPALRILCSQALVTISTVPLSYKGWQKALDWSLLKIQLQAWVDAAAAHEAQYQQRCVLCFEPEPNCSLELSTEVAACWQHQLPQYLQGPWTRYLALCWDTCHASVEWEDQGQGLDICVKAGAMPLKCQISACPEASPEQIATLKTLDEPRFLHQCGLKFSDGRRQLLADLNVLDEVPPPGLEAVRSHFHIPLNWNQGPHGLGTTHAESLAGARAALGHGCQHLALETYTWSIFADEPQRMISGVADELLWVAAQLDLEIPH